MNKFRASYSVLYLWERGLVNDAITAYFHLFKEPTQQMAYGSMLHSQWREEIEKTNKLPKVFSSKDLGDPKPEYKLEVEIEDWLDFVGVIDCYDEKNKVVYEFKTGVIDSNSYINKMQIPVYAYLLEANNKEVKSGVVYHFNQYTSRIDDSYMWITPVTIEKAKNWIISLASDMYHYLTENGLYDLYTSKDYLKYDPIELFDDLDDTEDIDDDIITN